MCLIPIYYCDRCGHAFATPMNFDNKGWRVIDERDEADDDSRCPKCYNPNYELLQPEKHEQVA